MNASQNEYWLCNDVYAILYFKNNFLEQDSSNLTNADHVNVSQLCMHNHTYLHIQQTHKLFLKDTLINHPRTLLIKLLVTLPALTPDSIFFN